jgi:cell division protein FtsI/penicillin-binding protein 2
MGLTFATKRPRRFLRWRTLVVVVVLGAIGAGVFVVLRKGGDSKPPLPSSEVDAFLEAWKAGDAKGMAAVLDLPPKGLDRTATSLVRARPGNRASYTRTGLVRDAGNDKEASATYHGHVDVDGFGAVDWDGSFRLVRMKQAKDEVWRIQYQPDILYPGLRTGQYLDLRVSWPSRASIIAADGSLLAGAQSVVTIGLEPRRVTKSLDDIKRLMKQLVGTDPASIDAALHAPGVQPNWFVPIATVADDARYTTVLRPQLFPLAGLSFQRARGVLSTSAGLAPLVGRVGEITADRLKELGAPYRVGDQVGLTGLQAAYEKRLAGTPTADVVIKASSKVVRRVKRFAGKAGQSVRLTVDPRMQQAAEAALTGVPMPAALVAMDVTNGQLRAVASKPDGGFNRALAGTYEPGSTFKVVTSAALLANGSTGATPAPCPATLQVFGRVFKNFEGEASGSLDLASAFKISCNNAFIGLADKLPEGALARAAAQFGFNAKSALPPPAAGGSYPTPKDRAELAASAIGQGRVLVSPAHMASVAAAVAAGQWHAPVLTTVPKPKVPKVAPLDAGVAATLRTFMASVVQSGGTAAGAGLPPGTFGKTGTAEFGNANPPQTHAWFIGFRGDLAVAVVVEGGGVGGRVAAPLAAQFLNAVP